MTPLSITAMLSLFLLITTSTQPTQADEPSLSETLGWMDSTYWLFAGSDRGGERAAAMYTLIATAKLNGIDPQAWLADVLRRIADHPASRLHELLPWHWQTPADHAAAA